ncbi:MAG: pyrimidine 5'-nucleotidase [Proteobacteria bacterium]|nr:pyrimidine 5'-nucleotidase [Pseudomonadota bacterium]
MKQTSTPKYRLIQAECWVFDLDNTLYPSTSDLFSQVDQRMTRFIADFLDMSLPEAAELRRTYYLEHGTTLAGLMALHGMHPEAFLDYVHDIDLTAVTPDPVLNQALSRLPGRKVIFTNGPTNHAVRILERLSISHHFEDIYDIVGADYIPKPKPEPYDALMRRCKLKPSLTVMVEDLARNLIPAAEMGMTTVWVRPAAVREQDDLVPAHVDHVVDYLAQWLGALTAE